jgi:hypothetical protein
LRAPHDGSQRAPARGALIGSVLAGTDAGATVGTVTNRLGIVTAVMLSEASEKIDLEPDGEPVDANAPAYRRYVALLDGGVASR